MPHDSSDKYTRPPTYTDPKMQRAQFEAKTVSDLRTLKETTRVQNERLLAVEKKGNSISSDMQSVTQLINGYDGKGGMLSEVRLTKTAVEEVHTKLEKAGTQAKTLLALFVVVIAVIEIVIKLV